MNKILPALLGAAMLYSFDLLSTAAVIVLAVAGALLIPQITTKFKAKRHVKPTFAWPEQGGCRTPVVGESYYQAALKSIAAGRQQDYETIPARALLIPEQDNRHDKNAVRVQINGMTVGHLSRANAIRYRRALSEAQHPPTTVAECAAAITGGFKLDDGTQANFGVIVCIPPLGTDQIAEK